MNSYNWVAEENEQEPDTAMHFYVFMMVFWPVSLLLGLIDYYYIRDYDLRLVNLVLGAAAAWIGMKVYQARERKQLEAG